MTAWKLILQTLIILAMVLLMAAPFLLEFITFRQDKKNKISYKRFRIAVFTIVYAIAVTILLRVWTDFVVWLRAQPFVHTIVTRTAADTRTVYYRSVLVAILVNAAIGFLFVFLSKWIRIGMKKKNLVTPARKDGTFVWWQKAERKIIRFFHTETWFFVGTILKYVSGILSALYALIFLLYQIPAVYTAAWVPYDFIQMVFRAGYLYPAITLLVLWEITFFLEGIRRLETECPELLKDADDSGNAVVDLEAIDEEVRRQFRDFYACDVDLSDGLQTELLSDSHHRVTEYIAQAVENDSRNPGERKETYLDCMDKLVEGDTGLLISGNFFSGFSMYFLRYLSVIVARGDNVVFVCNTDTQIDMVYDYLVQGLSEISSLFCKDFRADAISFDEPIWRIVKVSGEHSVVEEASVDEHNILVTSLSYLCSTRFETEHSRFISLIDAVVFVDTLHTVNTFHRQLAILNTRLKHVAGKNALEARNGGASDMFRMRYLARQIRYICFDDTRTPGLDKILKNMLGVEFDSADAMHYHAGTMVRCYRYEGKVDDRGRRSCPKYLSAEEEIGAVMNMAVLCLAKGAGNVTVFTDDILPYGNIAETLAANMGQISVHADGRSIHLNRQLYNPDAYSVVIAMDSGDNLPAALRRYTSMMSDKPVLVIVFSRPYMLRDYYIDNIHHAWIRSQTERIPVEEGTRKDVAQRILVKANVGGISRAEVLRLAAGVPQFDAYAAAQDVNAILRGVLQVYGVPQEDRIDLFRYFEYTSSQNFDENGKYNSEIKITLRRQGKLFEMLNGRDMVVMIAGDHEMILPMPRSRLTQNYIVGQNLVHEGNIYHIQKIDTAAGRIYTRLAVGGKNDEAYRYVQARDYHLEWNPEQIELVFPKKHVVLNRKEGDVSIDDVYITVCRVPMEVVTNGYYEVDPYTLTVNCGTQEYHSISDPGHDTLARQTYRRYGNLTTPVYSAESVLKSTDLNAAEKGALMMSLRICGSFGADVNKTMALAAVMLGELLRSMFPSVADSIAVCPVYHGAPEDEEAKVILQKQPRIRITGESALLAENDFSLVILEDCATDLGVVSVLMSSGDNVLSTLFTPLFQYLKWYAGTEKKSDYLYYGLDHEPSCFDFASLHKMAQLLGDDKHDPEYIDIESVMDYEICDFCGKRYTDAQEVITLDDGRRMCRTCGDSLVGNNKKLLKAHLDRARTFLESTYGITLEEDYEFCFESTVKIANTLKQNRALRRRGSDVPLQSYVDEDKKVHVEYSVPSVNLSELLVRELTHVWQQKHLPDLGEELAEGHIALVAIQYLRFLNQNTLASLRTTYYETTGNPSGTGYRTLVRALLENPRYCNNPFRYLLVLSGAGEEENITPPTPRTPETEDYGKPYTPEQPDRCTDGNMTYFYYARLTESQQKLYDTLLAAIRSHESTAAAEGYTFEQVVQVSESILYDHPELFWYKTFSMQGSVVNLFYGADAAEAETLQSHIEEVVPKYLEGIEDTMSAYDAALRIHSRIIAAVDYDTIALQKQKEDGGPAMDKIDYLRTICGVFLQGKAVCEGYARAMQYLLQRCGIECAEATGHIRKETGEQDGGHAWNIVKLDGDYYYVDTTWDDSSNTVQSVKTNDIGFDYFCITADELRRTRDIDMCPTEMPECSAVRCNYFTHNDLVLDRYDRGRIREIAGEAAGAGRKSFTCKCKSKAVFEETLEKLCADGQDCYEVLKAAARSDKQILTNTYAYSYNKNIRTITVRFKYK